MVSMESNTKMPEREAICGFCNNQLTDVTHGNRQYHKECAYKRKLQRQKERYSIGNDAKLMIQKNESVLAFIHKQCSHGIPFVQAMEIGLKFNCPSRTIELQDKKIFMFDKYGYSIKDDKGQTLIIVHHESELM
jgi:hypothetical protein